MFSLVSEVLMETIESPKTGASVTPALLVNTSSVGRPGRSGGSVPDMVQTSGGHLMSLQPHGLSGVKEMPQAGSSASVPDPRPHEWYSLPRSPGAANSLGIVL